MCCCLFVAFLVSERFPEVTCGGASDVIRLCPAEEACFLLLFAVSLSLSRDLSRRLWFASVP